MAFEIEYDGFISLDDLTRQYLASKEYSSDTHLFMVNLNHIVRAVKELSYETMPLIIGEMFDVSQDKRINFTNLSVDKILFVGVVSNGRKLPMFEDNELPLITDGVMEFNPNSNLGYNFVLPMFNKYGEFVGGEFGREPVMNNIGHYRKDRIANGIVVATHASSVYIEFISPILSKTAKNFIPEVATEAIFAHVDYIRANANPMTPIGEKQRLKREYINQKKLLRARGQFPSLEAMINSFNRRNKQSAKY